MCVVCVFLHEDSISSKNSENFFFSSIRKSEFWPKFHSKSHFDHVNIITHNPPLSIRLFESVARLVPLDPLRAREYRPGKGSADSSSDLSPRANRNEYDHFSIYSKNRESEEIKGFSFPLATRFPPSKIFWWRNIRGQGKWKTLDFLRFTIFENIESDHIHFCSLEAKDQSSSQLSFFPGDLSVPG